METKTDEFYIGWQEESPSPFAKTTQLVSIILLLFVPVFAAFLVMNQRGFATSSFELGTLTTIEGILIKKPAPFLLVYRGHDVDHKPIFQNLLLVAPGKHGISEMLSAAEIEVGPIEGKMVRLTGSLIYHDGKTLLEVSRIQRMDNAQTIPFELPVPVKLGSGALPGEITDPKCLFGVMKPGEGKPHRSCAARCIAGGIPPVFRTATGNGQMQYLLLTGEQGTPINNEVLPFVGDAVWVCGDIYQFGDWLVFYKNNDKKITLATGNTIVQPPLCGTTTKGL